MGDAYGQEPGTEELISRMQDAQTPGQFIDSCKVDLPTLSDYLHDLLDEKGLKRADVVRDAGLNPTFGYQIFMGARHGSRNKLLQIAFAMGLTPKETERVLRLGGHAPLYVKDRRDAIILFCLNKGMNLAQAEKNLYELGEETICK